MLCFFIVLTKKRQKNKRSSFIENRLFSSFFIFQAIFS
ncbi:hypothetical protein CUZ91_0005 [Enterococcus xinjiangensis]|nr:hypothetical protein [Enterococcus lactis]